MRQALTAYSHGSAPIGAVIISEDGEVVATGRNNFSNDRLAHAETEALRNIPPTAEKRKCVIYTTMEPCPMCTGAIRMTQLKAIHLAARDPAAGSTVLLNASEFMRRFPCTVHSPSDSMLEFANIALVLEYRTRSGHSRWREKWHSYQPVAVEVGERLAETGAFSSSFAQASPELIYDAVCSRLRDAGT